MGAVVLVGGTSHVGKSTVARALAAELGWGSESTDQLARHPGRPWTARHPGVHQHFVTLPVPELTDRQLAHYRRMWPLVERLVTDALEADGGLVLEGSGVWPDLVAGLGSERVGAVWLSAPDAVLRDRIGATSGCAGRPAEQRLAVRRFVGRTLAYQARMRTDLERLGLADRELDATAPVPELVLRIRRLAGVA